jgi:hypothetical protein
MLSSLAGWKESSVSNRFVGAGRSGLKAQSGDGVELKLKLTDARWIDGSEPENSWLVPGVQYWLVLLGRDAMVGVRLSPWLDPSGRAWRSTPTPGEMAIWIGKTDPRLLRESPLTLEVAHVRVG